MNYGELDAADLCSTVVLTRVTHILERVICFWHKGMSQNRLPESGFGGDRRYTVMEHFSLRVSELAHGLYCFDLRLVFLPVSNDPMGGIVGAGRS